MKAEIIAIGTELLLGQIVNTNAQFISEQLAALGIPVYYHSVVGDNPDRLREQLEISSKRSNLLIFTGGLGPTKDDLTKETIATFLNRSLVLDRKAMDTITDFFLQRNMIMTENNTRQAMVIEGSTVLPNETGLAPGMAVERYGIHYLLFPGPPNELRPMFTNHGSTYMQALLPERKIVYSKVMRFCGIGESTLETELQDLIDQQTSPTIAPLAKDGEVTLRLTSYTSSEAEAEQEMKSVIQEIGSRVGQYLYGWNDESLEQVLIHKLRTQQYTLALAESCTGGLVSSMLTKVNGATQVFNGSIICYTNDVKQQLLDVPEQVLATDGAVSEQTARILAKNVKEKLSADIGVSITGVAGPSSSEGKPIGLVYIGFSLPHKSFIKEFRLAGKRNAIQARAAKLALFTLIRELSNERLSTMT